MTISTTLDENDDVWQNPNDPDDAVTLGDILRLEELKTAVLELMANIEDGVPQEDSLDSFYSKLETLEIVPSPCPLCGAYSPHSHDME